MKRLLLLMTISLLTLVFSPSVMFAQTQLSTRATGTVITSRLNVRTAPSINATRIGTLNYNYSAGVIGKNDDASWYQIILPGGSGWVSGAYLAVTNAHTVPVTYPAANPGMSASVIGVVNTGALNIRSIPSPTNNIPITYVLRSTHLTLIARNTDSSWYKVVAPDNVRGWVRSRYINITSGSVNQLPIITENYPGHPATPQVYVQGYVNTGALNVRSVPSAINNFPLTHIFRNTPVSIIGRNQDGRWYQVTVNGITGWVRNAYIVVNSGDVTALPVTG